MIIYAFFERVKLWSYSISDSPYFTYGAQHEVSYQLQTFLLRYWCTCCEKWCIHKHSEQQVPNNEVSFCIQLLILTPIPQEQ